MIDSPRTDSARFTLSSTPARLDACSTRAGTSIFRVAAGCKERIHSPGTACAGDALIICRDSRDSNRIWFVTGLVKSRIVAFRGLVDRTPIGSARTCEADDANLPSDGRYLATTDALGA